jgi:hypothetical protein
MPSSAVLDTAIGLVLFFFTVAVLCSAAVESCANLFRKRAKYLLRGLRDLLDAPQPVAEAEPAATARPMSSLRAASLRVHAVTQDERDLYRAALAAGSSAAAPAAGSAASGAAPDDTPVTAPIPGSTPTPATTGTAGAAAQGGPDWTTRLMAHPLVMPFKQSGPGGSTTRNPSYLPASTFATALLDEIVEQTAGPTTIQSVRDAVTRLPDEVAFKPALNSLLTTAGSDLPTFVSALEGWYDSKMDQIGGAYARWAKRWLIVFGIAAALVLQLDTIAIGRALYTTPSQRAVVVAAAGDGTLCPAGQPFEATRQCVTGQLDQLGATGLPIGWSGDQRPHGLGAWLLKLLGLALTAIAASLGAPFWFNVLNRLGSLRNSERPPSSSAS